MKIMLQLWMILCISVGMCQVIEKPQHLEITYTHKMNDKKILVLYHDETSRLHILTNRIKQKMDVTLCDIDKEQVPEASQFDLILLGDIVHQDDVSDSCLLYTSLEGSKNSCC